MDREQLLRSWLAWEAGRPEVERRLIKRAFVSLRKGLPVTVSELARELEVPSTSLRDYIEQLAGYGRVTLENEVITGAAGLSVAPANHRLLLAGQLLYTWCALDAVGIPAALAVDATIESSYAEGGDLRIEIAARGPRSPDSAWVRVVPPDQERKMCGGTCSHMVFTRSHERGFVSLNLDEAGAWGRKIWSAYAHSLLPGGKGDVGILEPDRADA